ncbi:hypothetical protein NKT34_13710 [Paenibacillus polysaccharolyticus]|uniref:hypothetical protein n=1 Tax=Paenibacillus polysaccharolyticus TaxID=582692 RepID=UPI0020A04A21|nr:hypothetical protein [Paenibacillus polysaccharolyticus]MCP1134356.1 hypothetical protein [Paenibacillus polysaccharolyticus]
MRPQDIQEGRTYHNGKGKYRKVVLIGNRHKDDADLYYQPESKDYWLAMTLVGFAKWAKGEGRESIPKEDTKDGI